MLLTDAKYWIVQCGIGHVAVEARGLIAWSITQTACGLSFRNRWPDAKRPHRICRKCREALKDFVLVESQ